MAKLKDLHIRVDEDTWKYATEIGKKYGISMAAVFRKALAGTLENVTSGISYVNDKQGDDIRNTIMNIYEKVGHIDRVLSGIGNNANQLAHLNNINKKIYELKSRNHPNIELIQMYQKQMSDEEYRMNSNIDISKIAELKDEYRKISKDITESLGRFID
ncbi:MAG: hypothetical protein E7302_08005 [Butyrivibrio sp.]|nr:hypothetical protein [Butyrivibrio sp.]